jgi:carotenoid cleavage dioxygenase-like enzyme
MKKPFIKNFVWHPENGTNFIIVDRKTGRLVKTIKDSNAFFAFHHVNAYEENDKIILDVITYPNAQIISNIAAHPSSNVEDTDRRENQTLSQTKLMRYILSVTNAMVQPVTLLETSIEFPRINEHYNAKSYRYVYAVDPRPLDQARDLRPLYKIDLITREKMLWQESGLIPGEPVFIPSPRAVAEDDGVIVSILLNENKQEAFLVILDAKNFKEIGRIYAPYPIPTGLHGQFFLRGHEKDAPRNMSISK